MPRTLPSPSQRTMSDDELALLGHLIGDGCTLPRHAIQYTTRERELAEIVADLATRMFGATVAPRIRAERGWHQVYLSAAEQLTHGKRNPVAAWMDSLGVFGLRSHEKRVPDEVFRQPPEAIEVFLRHLWATDGCLWPTDKPVAHLLRDEQPSSLPATSRTCCCGSGSARRVYGSIRSTVGSSITWT